MARYSRPFAATGRAKQRAYRQRQAVALLALYVIHRARATER